MSWKEFKEEMPLNSGNLDRGAELQVKVIAQPDTKKGHWAAQCE